MQCVSRASRREKHTANIHWLTASVESKDPLSTKWEINACITLKMSFRASLLARLVCPFVGLPCFSSLFFFLMVLISPHVQSFQSWNAYLPLAPKLNFSHVALTHRSPHTAENSVPSICCTKLGQITQNNHRLWVMRLLEKKGFGEFIQTWHSSNWKTEFQNLLHIGRRGWLVFFKPYSV